MTAADLAVARRFLDVLADVARTGEPEAMYPLLAPDVAWLTPMRELHGREEASTSLDWLRPPVALDIEFSEPTLTDLGSGRVVSEVRQTYRMKGTGDYAYRRDRRIDLTIQGGRIARYEMRIVG